MTKFQYFFSYLSDYSPKSYLIEFGFINKKGEKKTSESRFIPKVAVLNIDFDKKIIVLKAWFISKNRLGYLHHYCALREGIKAVEELELNNFNFSDKHNLFKIEDNS